jgi:hypothetical protein
MTSAMLSMLREVADTYGPALPLSEKLMSPYLPEEVLDGIPDMWAERRPQIVRNPSSAYHPYIPEPFTSRAVVLLGRTPVLDFADGEETRQDLTALRHHLLYAHGVTISDPIPKIFEPRYFSKFPAEEAFAYRRTRLANLAHFLIDADPLIEDGVIVFIPEPKYPTPFPYNARDLSRVAGIPGMIRAVGRLDPEGRKIAARAAEEVLNKPEGSMVFGPESYAGITLNGILAGMSAGEEGNGGWDLYLPHREMQAVMKHLLRKADGNLRSANAKAELRLMHDLLSLELPGIKESISPTDLVAIRRNAASFAEWRTQLQGALFELADQLNLDPEIPQAVRRRILQERLSPAAAHAQSEVGHSAALNQLKSGGVVAAIGTVLGLPFGPALPAVEAATLAGLAGAVIGWLQGTPTRAAKRALARQYAIFTPKNKHTA